MTWLKLAFRLEREHGSRAMEKSSSGVPINTKSPDVTGFLPAMPRVAKPDTGSGSALSARHESRVFMPG